MKNMIVSRTASVPHLKKWHIRGRFILLSIIWLATIATQGCISHYKTFSSGLKPLDFSFEYPRMWWFAQEEQYPTLSYASIVGPEPDSDNESTLNLDFSSHSGNNQGADLWAQQLLDSDIAAYQREPNFDVIMKDTFRLDGVNGYRVEFIYDDTIVWKTPTRIQQLYMYFPRNRNVYEISISGSPGQWGKYAFDIQHILDTFRWK